LQSLRHIADLNIAVNLGWQNKGIGRRLLEQLIDRAKKSSDIEKIQLNVRASNIPATSPYKKMGFQEEGRLKNRVKIKDRYIDDFIMGLELKKFQEVKDFVIRPMNKSDIAKIARRYSFPWSTLEKTKTLWDTYYLEHENEIRTVAVVVENHEILGYRSVLRKPECPFFCAKEYS